MPAVIICGQFREEMSADLQCAHYVLARHWDVEDMLERSCVNHRIVLGMQTRRQRFVKVLQDRGALKVTRIHRVDAPRPHCCE